MKLKEYLDSLNKKIKKNPKVLDFDVVMSSDDEGNSFQHVSYAPTLGKYVGGAYNGEFDNDTSTNPEDFNAVCIN